MALLQTTRGLLEESTLDRRIVRHPRRVNNVPSGESVWTEYYADFTSPGEGGELVKRDIAHRKYTMREIQDQLILDSTEKP